MASGEYLDRIQHTRLLDIEAVNKALYLYIPEMEEARVSYSQAPEQYWSTTLCIIVYQYYL